MNVERDLQREMRIAVQLKREMPDKIELTWQDDKPAKTQRRSDGAGRRPSE